MREDIIAMLEDMNDAQIERVLDYVTNEHDEENFEARALDMIRKLQVEVTAEKVKSALRSREEFPQDAMKIVEEVCSEITEENV